MKNGSKTAALPSSGDIDNGGENVIIEKSREKIRKDAAIVIQCGIRVFLANKHSNERARQVWQRVFDPAFKLYFWHDRVRGDSTWEKPRRVHLFSDEDIFAARIIQKFIRGFIGKMRARKVVYLKYMRYYDANQRKFYWYDKTTEKTFWVVSDWLIRQNIPLTVEDQMIYDSHLKIQELEKKLQEKEKEIKEVRKKRFEELEPQVMKDKLTNAKSARRSRFMHLWSTEQLAAWFTELKMEQYIPFLFSNRVDGNLFINLADDEWQDMGITNKFHARKLQLILRGYRQRHKRVRAGGFDEEDDDDEDDGSEYSPSELSAAIAAEGRDYDEEDEEDNREEEEYYSDEEVEDNNLEEERRLQSQMDGENIKIQVVVLGDAVNYPMVGDVVRVRYTCSLTDTGQVVMSTKSHLQGPWVEFVLGVDHVIKGFDRALPQMSVGERSTIVVSPVYAYGEEGLPPIIPPNASITFDLTLLGFRPRSVWVKPLLQDEKTNEQPFHEELKPVALKGGDDKKGNKIRILRDGELGSVGEGSLASDDLTSGGNRLSGSFQSGNRSSYNKDSTSMKNTSFNTSNRNSGSFNINNSVSRTSFNNEKKSFSSN